MRRLTAALGAALIAPIRVYKHLLSPLMPPSCRFTPTCSTYAIQAIEAHGPVRGVWLGTKRICRCHPWGGSGYDPVPATPAPLHAPAPLTKDAS